MRYEITQAYTITRRWYVEADLSDGSGSVERLIRETRAEWQEGKREPDCAEPDVDWSCNPIFAKPAGAS